VSLRRDQRLLLYKVSALLALVRWYNIFFLALAQYLAVLFILRDPEHWPTVLLQAPLHAIVFASLFSVAAGYIINAFYDREKDLINRPRKAAFERLLETSTTWQFYFLFNITALLLAGSVSFNVMLFFAAFQFSLWLYSHKLKRITLLGNIMAALLSITPFFALFLYYHLQDSLILIYVCFILLLILIREVIKDLEALRGDAIIGYPTVPVRWGVVGAKRLIAGLVVVGAIPAVALFIITGFSGISYYLAAGGLGVMTSLLQLWRADSQQDFRRLNNLYRALIIVGIFSLILLGISH